MPEDSSLSMSSSETPREAAESLIFSFLEEFQDPLFRYTNFRVQNRAVAIDIVQDVFAKVWLYLCDGKTIKEPKAFLYRVTKNAIIDYFKKKKSTSLESLSENGFEPESRDEEAQHEKNSDLSLVRDLLEQLDEESQQIIFMRFSEEKPIEEIALYFGKTTNAMTVKIHRILAKLRGNYESYDR